MALLASRTPGRSQGRGGVEGGILGQATMTMTSAVREMRHAAFWGWSRSSGHTQELIRHGDGQVGRHATRKAPAKSAGMSTY